MLLFVRPCGPSPILFCGGPCLWCRNASHSLGATMNSRPYLYSAYFSRSRRGVDASADGVLANHAPDRRNRLFARLGILPALHHFVISVLFEGQPRSEMARSGIIWVLLGGQLLSSCSHGPGPQRWLPTLLAPRLCRLFARPPIPPRCDRIFAIRIVPALGFSGTLGVVFPPHIGP